MKGSLATLSVILGVLISHSTAIAQSASPSFVMFDSFMREVSAARATRYLQAPGSRLSDSTAFEEMRNHVLSLYQGVHVTHSFTYNSQYVDCVPVLQQPGARRLGLKEMPSPPAPPSPPPGMSLVPSAPSSLATEVSDSFGNKMACEPGTIPMRRVTLEELSRYSSLDHYLRKTPDGSPPPVTVDFGGYRHRTVAQSVSNLGAASQFEVWYPTVATSEGQFHSLSQLWVLGVDGSGVLQSLEAGWQVAPTHYQTNAAVPFLYWTADSYRSTGCYNLECPGFVQYSNAHCCPRSPGTRRSLVLSH